MNQGQARLGFQHNMICFQVKTLYLTKVCSKFNQKDGLANQTFLRKTFLLKGDLKTAITFNFLFSFFFKSSFSLILQVTYHKQNILAYLPTYLLLSEKNTFLFFFSGNNSQKILIFLVSKDSKGFLACRPTTLPSSSRMELGYTSCRHGKQHMQSIHEVFSSKQMSAAMQRRK